MRGVIDAKRNEKGRFIITGSSSPELHKHISESLAGRIATVELSTLKVNEYCNKPLNVFYEIFTKPISKKNLNIIDKQSKIPLEKIQHVWLYGGYPEPLLANDLVFHELWMKAYHDTYINRDIAKLFPQLNILAYQRFLSMLCHLSGTILNRSDIARALGVSEKSVREYLQIAAGTFLWRQILSYEKSGIKSIVKLPKGHIRDTGLLHYLLHINSLEKLYSHPIVGRSFESFVIEEILKGLSAVQTTNWQAYYYRTRHGVEIDLILSGKFGILPIEIKHGSNPKINQLRHLEDFIETHKLPFGLLINQAEEACWLTKGIFQLPIGYL
jgi:predicted AAA+ superfamily ATPase